MKSGSVLVYSACDLGNNDGFNGHLRLVLELIALSGFEPRVVGYTDSDRTVLPYVWKKLPRYGQFSALVVALRFALAVLAEHPAFIVLTSAGSPYNPFLAMLARFLKIPVLYDCHDPVVDAVTHLYARLPLIGLVRGLLILGDKILDRCVALTLAVSPGVIALMRGRGWSGPIELFYNVHNATEKAAAPNRSGIRKAPGWTDATVLVYVGGMQRNFRGLEDQFAAVRAARARGRNVRFVVAYGSGFPEQFDDFAAPLVADDAYRVFANLSPSQVADLLADSDIAVNKTLTYAMPSKIFEYVANGLHILSVDDGGCVNDVFRGFVTPYADDVSSLTDALVAFGDSRGEPLPESSQGERLVQGFYAHNRTVLMTFCARYRER